MRIVLFVTVANLCACATAELKGAPDAGADACASQAVTFCVKVEAGAVGCVADPSAASPTVRQLPPGTYPVGCKANLVGSDPNGECKLVTTCTCSAPAAPDVRDAGDAGDAGDAAVGLPQPPAWQCD